ncbi:MAG: hypothetical protein JNL01_07430 [Bdellovibrionales bacterium]|nr:hypothetical protein [Bdellovibrionales bacterium]
MICRFRGTQLLLVLVLVSSSACSVVFRNRSASTSTSSEAPSFFHGTLTASPPTWTAALSNTVSRISSARADMDVVVASDGKVYVIGGFYDDVGDTSGMNAMKEVHRYDPTTEQWTSMAPMNQARTLFGTVKLSDGRIWVGGGLNWVNGAHSYLKTTEIYDPATDTWTKRADMPFDLYRFAVAHFTASDGLDRIAVIGGKQNTATTVDTIYIYDPARDTWSNGPTMTTPRSDAASVTLPDGRVFVGSGLNGGNNLSYGFYDPLAGTWTDGVNSMVSAHPKGAVHFVSSADSGLGYDSILIFGGGYGTGMSPNNTVERLRLDTGVWNSMATMSTSVGTAQIVAVGGDKFLRVGGITGAANASSVEEYDLSANAWTAKASIPAGRGSHVAVLLSNNKILCAGGTASTRLESLPKNFLYTQGSPGSWAETGHFHIQTENYVARKLADGKVLKCGGYSTLVGATIADCFLFNPSTGNWDTVGKMTTPRKDFTMTVLPSGNVLAAGGEIDDSYTVTNTAEIYDASTRTWTATGSFTNARRHHRAILLSDGATVLIAGGNNGATTGGTYFTNAQKYSIAGGTWSNAGTMNANRGNHVFVLLNDGRVFAHGGFSGATTNTSAEIYDPTGDTWTPVTSSTAAHGAPSFVHTGTGANERIYVIAGFTGGGGSTTTVNEYYDVTLNSWTSRTAIASGRWGMGTAFVANRFIYVFGGQLGSVSGGTPTTEVRRYDTVGNSWTNITAIGVSQSADLRYSSSLSTQLDDGRVLISGTGSGVRTTEIYSFVTTLGASAVGGWDSAHTFDLFSGIGTFYTNSKLYVPQYSDFSAVGGAGSTTTRIRVVDQNGGTSTIDVTIP